MRSNRVMLLIAGLLILLCALTVRSVTTSERTSAVGAFGHGPTVVLVHGLGSRATHWLPMARDLARDHRVVLIDLPGHGLADMPGVLTLDDAVAMLDRAIEAEAPDGEPVLLVGHSAGGLVATAEALAHPERVRGLVLVETALRPQMSEGDREQLLESLDKHYRATLRANYESFGRDSAQGAELFRDAAQLDSTAMKQWIDLAVSTDLSGEVQDLRTPVLAVFAPHSWGDTETWLAAGEAMGYGRMPHVTPLRIPGCGHFIMLDRPGALAGAIRRFGRGTGAPVVAMR